MLHVPRWSQTMSQEVQSSSKWRWLFSPYTIAIVVLVMALVVCLYVLHKQPEWRKARMERNGWNSVDILACIWVAQQHYVAQYGAFGSMEQLLEAKTIEPEIANATTPEQAIDGYYFAVNTTEIRGWWYGVSQPKIWGVTGERNYYIGADAYLRWSKTQGKANNLVDFDTVLDQPVEWVLHAAMRRNRFVSIVRISNSSDCPLQQVTVSVGDERHSIPLLPEKTGTDVLVSPPDSRDVHVSFNCNGLRRTVNCGAIGNKGEYRTVDVLKNGQNVRILFRTANGEDATTKPTTIVLEDE